MIAAILTIAKRDLRLLLGSTTGMVVGAVWMLVSSSLFWLQLLSYEELEHRALGVNDPSLLSALDFNDLLLASTFSHMPMLLALTAVLFATHGCAGERRDGTLVLLLQSPWPPGVIILGKLLALAAVVAMMVSWLSVFAIVLATWGRADGGHAVDVPQLLCALFGLWCLGVACMAVALAASSMTAQPLSAAVLTFACLLVLWLLPTFSGYVGGAGEVLRAVAPTMHIEPFLRGVLDVRGIMCMGMWMIIAVTAASARLSLSAEQS